MSVHPVGWPAAVAPTPPRRSRAGLWAAIAGGAALLLVLCCVGGVVLVSLANKDPRPGPKPTPGDGIVRIGVDLPFQGPNAGLSNDTFNTMQLYLDELGGVAGSYPVELYKYDDSTVGAAGWDEQTCRRNADRHVANAAEVAVVGTLNSGCSQTEVPILNAAGMLMVSPANGYPGLTREWDTGEPDVYYPSGPRNFARVFPTDDGQGDVLARVAAIDLHAHQCMLVTDGTVYGNHMAAAFIRSANILGTSLLGPYPWLDESGDYTNPFELATDDWLGTDCIVATGSFAHHGDQLMRDKVTDWGPNSLIPFLASDGFLVGDDFNRMSQADGAIMVASGLEYADLVARSTHAQTLADAFQTTYGRDLDNLYALYATQALQLVLSAVQHSDGTRESVRAQLLGGASATIPKNKSILGPEVSISATGDVSPQEFEVYQVSDGQSQAAEVVTV